MFFTVKQDDSGFVPGPVHLSENHATAYCLMFVWKKGDCIYVVSTFLWFVHVICHFSCMWCHTIVMVTFLHSLYSFWMYRIAEKILAGENSGEFKPSP